MPPKIAKHRLLLDRERLVDALRDCETGKYTHLSGPERDHMVASLKQRIEHLNIEIRSIDEPEGS